MKLTRRVLLNQAKPWVFTGCDFQTEKLGKEMLSLMRKENGIGLAATQIGLSKRVFVMQVDGRERVCFNPEIVSASDMLAEFAEGCLSFPGEQCIIKRPDTIAVRYQDYRGEWVNDEMTGLEARCFQHELDHLNGIVMHDRQKEQDATESRD
jgi:peptide deformylase